MSTTGKESPRDSAGGATKVSPIEAEVNALGCEIGMMERKRDRLLLAIESRKLKQNRLLNLIVADVGADLTHDG